MPEWNRQQLVSEKTLRAAESLRGASLKTHTEEQILSSLNILLESYRAVGIGRSHHQTWYRARICTNGEPFAHVGDMIYKRGGSDHYGRCSMPGEEVFYAAWNFPTAIAEVRAKQGDVVQVARVRVVPGFDLPCHVVGELHALYASGRSIVNSEKLEKSFAAICSQSDFISQLFVDAFLGEDFARRVADENHDEYALSAMFASKLLRIPGGLMYPSVASRWAVNLAVSANTFNSAFEVLSCTRVRVEQALGNSLYPCLPLGHTDDISEDGTFLWHSQKQRKRGTGSRGGEQFAEEERGWRHPSQGASLA